MTFWEISALVLASAAAGAVNAVAGGGTLLTFPVLGWILGNTPEALVRANATSTTALLPGSLAALGGYREEIEHSRDWILRLMVPSLLGGALGTLLVTRSDPAYFELAVPWLILTAALLFAGQPLISRWTGIGKKQSAPGPGAIAGILAFQFLVSLYGGYFGAGIGILMLAGLAVLGLSDIHQMNALKSFLGSCINGMSVVIFTLGGNVDWTCAGIMAVASIGGGYGAARVARRLDKTLVRNVVTVIGFALAAYYFYRRYA